MTTLLDRLRLTADGHGGLLHVTSWASAVFTVVFPYLLVGVTRYSFFSVIEPGPLVRISLIGLLGWGIVTVVVFVAAGALGAEPSWSVSARVSAQAHLPLSAAAVAIFGLGFALQAFDASRAVAVVTVVVWFPTAVIGATAYAASTPWWRAALPGFAAATAWGFTTGVPVQRLIGHLL